MTVTAPAPTVTITAPAPAPTPTPTREKADLTYYTLTLGSAGYLLGFGLAEQVNKNSDWLRIVPVETSGSTENAQIATRPGNRKISIFQAAVGTFYDMRGGRDVFKDKPYTFNILAVLYPWQNAMLTLDPNIKTYQDLAGKTVAIGYAPATTAYVTNMFFLEKAGVKDKAKAVLLSYAKMKDALLDGTIDAAALPLSGVLPKFLPAPALEELLASRKKVYSVQIPLELEEEAQRTTGIPMGFKVLPQTADPRMQNDWYVTEGASFVAASPELPDDIVLEILRVLWEQKGTFKNYYAVAESWTLQGFVDGYVERKSFHPAALKFWEGKGAKITYKEPW
ncbi:MAG: TAXI family TRAP transporter solute-binding subunit [Chloroflexi bacterium]|nr:TAXI family TRAP transporter solute-binding subunit [Chloroflexota bacterium]